MQCKELGPALTWCYVLCWQPWEACLFQNGGEGWMEGCGEALDREGEGRKEGKLWLGCKINKELINKRQLFQASINFLRAQWNNGLSLLTKCVLDGKEKSGDPLAKMLIAEGTSCQAWGPEFHSHESHSGRRDFIVESCLLKLHMSTVACLLPHT